MSIVWPCSLSVDEYVAAGREVKVPRPKCPVCSEMTTFWHGYRRQIREGGRYSQMWVPRVRCQDCSVTHALLPAFVVTNRLDVAESIGSVLEDMGKTSCGVRPVAERLDIPHTTVRGWVRRFAERASELAVAFAALAVELGGEVVTPLSTPVSSALESLRAAWRAASGLPGWLGCGRWRFISSVTGGNFVATNTNSPYLFVGKRRFMPPVP
jgi:transposase-like protein